METPRDLPEVAFDRRTEVVADALDVLGDLTSWRLASARWTQVQESLALLGAALDRDDMDAARAAVATLELMGPVKFTRIGSIPVLPAPAPIRERVHYMVHLLNEFVAESAAEQRADGGVDERTATRRS